MFGGVGQTEDIVPWRKELKMKRHVCSRLNMLCLLLVTVGCVESRDGNFQGTVSHVRLTFERALVQEDAQPGDPVAGAVIGGLVAGTPGAIIGAAIGDDGRPERSSLVQNRLIACSFLVTLPDRRRATFRISRLDMDTFNDDLFKASTLRDGDTLSIRVSNGWFGWNGVTAK